MKISHYILSLLIAVIAFSCGNSKENHFAIFVGEPLQKAKIDSFILQKPIDYTSQVMSNVKGNIDDNNLVKIDTLLAPMEPTTLLDKDTIELALINSFDTVVEVKESLTIDPVRQKTLTESKPAVPLIEIDSLLPIIENKTNTLDSTQMTTSDIQLYDRENDTLVNIKTNTPNVQTNTGIDSLKIAPKRNNEVDSLKFSLNTKTSSKLDTVFRVDKVSPNNPAKALNMVPVVIKSKADTIQTILRDTVYIQQIVYKVDTIVKWKENQTLKTATKTEVIPIPTPVILKQKTDTIQTILRDTVYIKEVVREKDTIIKWKDKVIEKDKELKVQPEIIILYYRNNQLIPTDLNKAITELKSKVQPITQIQVSSFTDSGGATQYNQAIAMKRSLLIKEQLIKAGFDPKIVFVQSFGEQYANSTIDEKDRKTEIKIIY